MAAATYGARYRLRHPESALCFASTNKGLKILGSDAPKSQEDIEISIAQNTGSFDIVPAAPPGTWLCPKEDLSIQQAEVVVRLCVSDVQSLAEWKAYQIETEVLAAEMRRNRVEILGANYGFHLNTCRKPRISLQALKVLPVNLESNRGELCGILRIQEWLPDGRVCGVTSFPSDTGLNLAGATLIRHLSWDFIRQHYESKVVVGIVERVLSEKEIRWVEDA